MSHISTIPSPQFVDRAILEAAIKDCQVEDLQIAAIGQTVSEVTDFNATVSGDFAGKISPSICKEPNQWMAPQGFAIARDESGGYKLLADEYGTRRPVVAAFLEKLTQRYFYHAALATIPEGFMMTSVEDEDGELVITLNRIG